MGLQFIRQKEIVEGGGNAPHHHTDVRHIKDGKIHEQHVEHIHHEAPEDPVDKVAHRPGQQQGQDDLSQWMMKKILIPRKKKI